jgi:hypothetical protein
MADMGNPGALAGATGAGKPVHATADGPRNVAQKPCERKAGTPYRVTPSAGKTFTIAVSSRTRWALDRLRASGERGCTPITQRAPRWSAYVQELRALDIEIETVREPHEGDFPGWHGRYMLRCHVAPERKGGAS